jgi:hypothetical protein
MKIHLVLTIALMCFLRVAYTEGIFYKTHSGFTVNNKQNPFKDSSAVQSDLMCLALCNQESNCHSVNFNQDTKICSLFDNKIDTNNLVSKSSSVVFIVKGNRLTLTLTMSNE